ncbi:MAG: T9SS type A sorting domain-containing protein [Bacteroidota bacterium]
MKIKLQFVALVVLSMSVVSLTSAQITTNGTGGGNWSSTSTWVGGVVPAGSATMTVQATDSLFFDVQVTITGSLKNLSGRIGVFDSSKVTFGNGGVYEHAVNGSPIPKVTWGTGSTCLISGVTANAPSNGNQNFYNLTWNCPGQTSSVNLGWNGLTIGGDVNVLNTGTATYFRFTSNAFGQSTSAPNVITINGNLNISGNSYCTATGSGAPTHYIQVIVNGNVTDTASATSAFQLGNGSGGQVAWKVKGNVTTMPGTGGTFTTNSTASVPDTLFFAGTGVQTFKNSVASLSNIKIVVNPDCTLTMDTTNMGASSSTTFALSPGATFICSHPSGLNGNLTGSGAKTLDTTASYGFYATSAQVTGALLPATVKDLTINNSSGVTLTQTTKINGVLHLKAGQFDNTIAFTLGPSGSIVNEGGTLKIPFTAVEQPEQGAVPQTFFVDQNYPNPFNPSTVIRFGIPNATHVSLKIYDALGREIAELANEQYSAGTYTVPWNAIGVASGVYYARLVAGDFVAMKKLALVK